MITLSPSLLAADFMKVNEQLVKLENAGVSWLHLDVMDGVFVPNISFGLPVISSLRKSSGLFFDVHLMIVDPLSYVQRFSDAGADSITFHFEACVSDSEVYSVIDSIRKTGKKCGVSIKPNTAPEKILKFLPLVDMVLVMTVEPGFGGQSLIASTLDNVSCVKTYIDKYSLSCDIQVDGGIDFNTITSVIERGANVIVAGSFLFGADDITATAKKLMLY